MAAVPSRAGTTAPRRVAGGGNAKGARRGDARDARARPLVSKASAAAATSRRRSRRRRRLSQLVLQG